MSPKRCTVSLFLLLQIQFHFYVRYAVFGKFAGYLPKAYLFIQSAGIRLRLNRYFFCGELFFLRCSPQQKLFSFRVPLGVLRR